MELFCLVDEFCKIYRNLESLHHLPCSRLLSLTILLHALLGRKDGIYYLDSRLSYAVINTKGKFVAIKVMPGNLDDRQVVVDLTEDLTGYIFADKGYIDHKLLNLRKRFIIETVFDYLKNKMTLEHSRHRSLLNAFVHILSTLVAYSLKKTKPSTTTSSHSYDHLLIEN